MSRISNLFLELAPIINKFILSTWLRDANLLSEGIGNIVDILWHKTEDKLVSRKIERELDNIIDKICEQMIDTFKRDRDVNFEAIIYSVKDNLYDIDISKQMINYDLDPIRLSRFIIQKSNKYTLGLNDSEQSIYRQIVEDTCKYSVSIASEFPKFNENFCEAMLQGKTVLTDIAFRILTELKEIRENSEKDNFDKKGAKFQEEYLQLVIRHLSRLELYGLSSSRITKNYSLEIAYIPIQLKQSVNSVQEDGIQLVDSMEDLLKNHSRLFLIGEPGSGKTTVMQWIAIRAAYRDFPDPINNLNGKIPFFIPLRRYAETELPTIEKFPGLIAKANIGTKPPNWVEQQLRDGKAIILIDGIDEISKKDDLFTWLDDLIYLYPKATYILTSRPSEHYENIKTLSSFTSADIQLMPPSSIDIFIDKWYSAIRKDLNSSEMTEDFEMLTSNLKLAIRQNRSILLLATNPLLCAVICALNFDLKGNMSSSNRLELYHDCCLMLLRRDDARKVDLSAYPKLNLAQKRKILEDLAYYFVRNGWSERSIEHVRRRIANTLKLLSNLPKEGVLPTPRNVTQYLVDRSGIIRQPIRRRVDFTHKTFQEYLGSLEAIHQDDIGIMIKEAHTDKWRELVLLAAGKANPKQQRQLIIGLIKRGDNEPNYKHQLHLMAVACLENATQISPRIKTLVTEKIEGLVPPKNLSEARAIASAGDLAVPYLLDWKHENESIVGSCLLALALIGSPLALIGLKNYSEDTGSALLVRVWEYFDKEEYAKTVLNNFDTLELQTLDGVQYLQNLKHIHYIGKELPNDISTLSRLPNFKTIDFPSDTLELQTLDGVQYVQNLKHIRYIGKELPNDISILSRLPNFKTIDFPSDTLELQTLDGVQYVQNLKHIRYIGKELPNDISILSRLPNFKTIDFPSDTLELQTLDGVQYAKNVKNLKYKNDKFTGDLKQLLSLTSLEGLYISGLTDIHRSIIADVIPKLKNLKKLFIYDLKTDHFEIFDFMFENRMEMQDENGLLQAISEQTKRFAFRKKLLTGGLNIIESNWKWLIEGSI